MHHKARRVVGDLFAILHCDPGPAARDWRVRVGPTSPAAPRLAIVVADYNRGDDRPLRYGRTFSA